MEWTRNTLSSLDFMVNRFFIKLFISNDMQTIVLLSAVQFKLPSERIAYRCKKFAALNL